MIVTEFYDGQGFGNQLWSYATIRCLSLKLGMQFGIQSKKRFKGNAFLDLDMGAKVLGLSSNFPNQYRLPLGIKHHFWEKKVHHSIEGYEITPFDEGVFNIKDKTKIDGYFQSEILISPYKKQISEWFKVEPFNFNVDYDCLINIRGGEYVAHPTLILSRNYYLNAIKFMKSRNNCQNFAIVTDDPKYASALLPGIPLISTSIENYPNVSAKIRQDFGLLQNAKNLILSNSSFSWWAAWTNQKTIQAESVIAPKYWARHNAGDGFWSLGGILTKDWTWIDNRGLAFSSEDCLTEKLQFESQDYFLKHCI